MGRSLAGLAQHLIRPFRRRFSKTDVVDAAMLARVYASGFLPEVRVPDWRFRVRPPLHAKKLRDLSFGPGSQPNAASLERPTPTT